MTSYKGEAVTLKKGNGKNHKVTVPATSIVWDGKVVGIPCYKIDGAYYVSAAAIAECGDSEGVSKYLCEYTKETVRNLKEFY